MSPEQPRRTAFQRALCSSLILVASFATIALGRAASTEPPKQKPAPDFHVSGTVVETNKSPLKDIEVMIAEATDKGVSLTVDALNTKANTDANGEFSIPVAKSMFQKHQQFVIMVRRSGSSSINLSDDPIRASTGGLAVVTIDARVKEYRVEIVHDVRFTLANLSFVLLDGGPAQATATTSQAAATASEIRLSNKAAQFPDLELKGQMRLEVLKGEAHLTSGATLLQGSDMRVEEAWITFEKGMTVVAGTGGARLKGINHPEGTRLIVGEDGTLVANESRAGSTDAQGAQERTDSWPTFDENPRFTIRYPQGWRIRERETDADGEHVSFNDNTTTVGGIGVSLLKRSSAFGPGVAQPDAAEYAAMLKRLVQVEARFAREFTRRNASGKQFTATQTLNGQPVTWRLDVVEMDAEYVALVFGFYRPSNRAQSALVEAALDTFELRAR